MGPWRHGRMSRPEMKLDEIAQLTRLVVGDTDGRKVGDEKAALRLIGVHIPELCAVIAEDEKMIAKLTDERDDARSWVRRITAARRVLTCVYCGEAYPPGSPDHGADVLTAHVKVCEKHPMRASEVEIARLRQLVEEALGHVRDPDVTSALRARIVVLS